MVATVTSVPTKKKLAKKTSQSLVAKERPTKEQLQAEEEAALQRFKDLMLNNAGKCSFDSYID